MEQTVKATEIETGYHPEGYRIDKTASPMNLYTKWQISDDGRWHSPEPVDFEGLPQKGWKKVRNFNWNDEIQQRDIDK